MNPTQDIRDLALGLSPRDRASLAHDLLASLGPNEPLEDVESAWAEEAEARSEAFAGGRVSAEDWEVSLERVRRKLREGPAA